MKIVLLTLLLSSGLFAETPKRKMGWISNATHAKGLTQMVPRRVVPLPAAASLLAAAPPVYDQGNIGSCVANAGGTIQRFQWKVQHNVFLSLSRLDLYQNCLKHDGSFPNDNGTYTSTMLWVLKNQGVAMEQCWPYKTNKLTFPPSVCADRTRSKYSATVIYDVPTGDGGRATKECIAILRIPVAFGGYVYDQINYVNKQLPYIAMPSGRAIGGHEMVIIGYDDNKVVNGRKGWVLIQNSWSTSWGDGGRAWMPYDYVFNTRYCEDFGAIKQTR